MIFLITLVISVVIAFFLVNGIDYMDKNHPDYKGEDLFGNEEDKK
jgi:hypothetical protein